MKIDKVTSLPVTLNEDTIYLQKNTVSNKLDCHITDNTGTNSFKVNANNIPNINGNNIVYIRETAYYEITNYDINQVYNITPISGSYTLNVGSLGTDKAFIEYTVPETIQPAGFIINGRRIELNLSLPTINIPNIGFEGDGIVMYNYINDGIFSNNKSITPDRINNLYPLVNTQWQMATDQLFTNILHQIDFIEPDYYSYYPGNYSINKNNTYHIRTRHNVDLLGYSNWSNIITIHTRIFNGDFVYQSIETKLGHNEYTLTSFGNSDVLFIGTNDISGKVLVYDKQLDNSYLLRQTITNLNLFTVDTESRIITCSPDGNRIAIYTYSENVVYIYKLDTGTNNYIEEAVLTPNSGINSNTGFNSAMFNTNSDVLILGAPSHNHDSNITSSGAAIIYTRTGTNWALDTVIEPSTPSFDTYFAQSVIINETGDTLVIPNMNFTVGTDTVGCLELYTKVSNNWTLTTTIPNPLLPGVINGDVQFVRKASNLNKLVFLFSIEGHIVIYNKIDNSYVEEGRFKVNNSATFASDVQISDDGKILAISLQSIDTNNGNVTDSYIEVYKYIDNEWRLFEQYSYMYTFVDQTYYKFITSNIIIAQNKDFISMINSLVYDDVNNSNAMTTDIFLSTLR
jgi:hypothetical protein